MKKNNRLNAKKIFTDDGWVELVSQKEEFLSILDVMNRYYKSTAPQQYPSNASKFRESLLRSSPENFKIFIKKFGSFEYLISAELTLKEGSCFDSWIHVDGIEEEKKELEKKNILDHPVFDIISMTDLFMNSCKKIDPSIQLFEKFA